MKSINFYTGPAASPRTRDSIATGLHATFGHIFVILMQQSFHCTMPLRACLVDGFMQNNTTYKALHVRSGLKSLMMLKLACSNHVFQEKYQLDLPSVLILGKPIPELPREDMFIDSSIRVKSSTVMEKKIISMIWRDSGDFSNENSLRTGE